MIDLLNGFNFSFYQWLLAVLCGMMVGMAKTGVAGIGLLTVAILAGLFGGKASTGILLPMLSMADVFAVLYYSRHANWNNILRLLPWALLGILIALFLGQHISDQYFKSIIGIIILISIGLIFWKDFGERGTAVPDNWWFAGLMGLAGGFTTMIGNAAGPIMALYLLAMKLSKNAFIGTAAWFFMIINLSKIPLHIFFWKTITIKTLTFNLVLLPAIALGAFLGVRLVKRIPEKSYRIFIIVITAISAMLLLIK